jgi:anaerobic dimethyl sulfoxide reductase subunit B (iron-sulfur subunit)
MRRTFVFDQEKCMGCNTCTVSCKDWNQVNPGPARWRKQVTHEKEYQPYFFPLAMSCNHCETPACVAACAVGAIKKRESDGVVSVSRNECINLRACITACPFAEPQIAEDQQEPVRYQGWQVAHPMQKCDFCMERIDKGLEPICVASCPAHALEAGDYDYLKAKYLAKGVTLMELNQTDFPYAYVNNTETGPSFLVRKRHNLTVTKAVE